jgi:hypothetical protein
VYEMYPWNPATAPAGDHAGSARPAAAREAAARPAAAREAKDTRTTQSARRDRSTEVGRRDHSTPAASARHTRAVQFALDRRDNGGRSARDRLSHARPRGRDH